MGAATGRVLTKGRYGAMVVRIMFDVDESSIPDVLRIMAPHTLGPIVIGYRDEEAEGHMDPRKVRDVFHGRVEPEPPRGRKADKAEPAAEAPPRRNGPVLAKALEVLRNAGSKGLASGNFHDAMRESGLDRKASHNALFNVKKLGLARQGPNKRVYITREGNARASS